MAKSSKQKFYAVRNGRDGPQIYDTWEQTKAAVSRFPGAKHKSFYTLQEAEAWVAAMPQILQPSQAAAWNKAPSGIEDSMDLDEGFFDAEEEGPYPPSQFSGSQPNAECHGGPTPGPSSQHSTGHASSSTVTCAVTAPPPIPTTTTAAHFPVSDRPRIPDAGPVPPPPAPAPLGAQPEDIQLSPEQKDVIERVRAGKSVFFTGSAGTGKSVLLREIIRLCGGRPSRRLAVTASTGIASVNIGGCTLHSWAGIGLGKEPKEKLLYKIIGISLKQLKEERAARRADPAAPRREKVMDRWESVRTLIIDEISMIDGKLFDKLEWIARQLRDNEYPFGGIQLVLSGDFCQLPPVPDKDAKGSQIPAVFAFDADSWNRCVGPPVVLTRVFRQRDQKFVDMLNSMRFGEVDGDTVRQFMSLSRKLECPDGIEPAELYARRDEVLSANTRRLNALRGATHTYPAIDIPGMDEHGKPYPIKDVERGLKDVVAPKCITLKIGAQVMLVKNLIQGQLVNGSIGRVVGFNRPKDAQAAGQLELGIPETQAQGPLSAQTQEAVKRKIERIMQQNSVWPVVQFQTGHIMMCVPLTFEVNTPEGTIQARREQVPLILAWALSIHKSQGQTLELVRVNLGSIFEKGQAYVALSRATRLEGLQVLHFQASKVMAHPRVIAWMQEQTGQQLVTPKMRDEIDDDLEYWQDDLE